MKKGWRRADINPSWKVNLGTQALNLHGRLCDYKNIMSGKYMNTVCCPSWSRWEELRAPTLLSSHLPPPIYLRGKPQQRETADSHNASHHWPLIKRLITQTIWWMLLSKDPYSTTSFFLAHIYSSVTPVGIEPLTQTVLVSKRNPLKYTRH